MTFKLTRRAWIRTIIYSGLATAGAAGYVSSKRPEKVKRDVPITGLQNALEGLTIGVMADFHAGAFASEEDIHRVVRMVNREEPDIVALLGDYIDGAYSHSPKNVQKGAFVFDALKRLKAPLGVYAVLGNHDHWTDAAQVRRALSRIPVIILDNQAVHLPNGLALAGVDDYWEGPSDPSKAMRSLDGESAVICSPTTRM